MEHWCVMPVSFRQQRPQPEGAHAHGGSDELHHLWGRHCFSGAIGHGAGQPGACTQGTKIFRCRCSCLKEKLLINGEERGTISFLHSSQFIETPAGQIGYSTVLQSMDWWMEKQNNDDQPFCHSCYHILPFPLIKLTWCLFFLSRIWINRHMTWPKLCWKGLLRPLNPT